MTFADKILEAAQEGIVLLRNEKETLPLNENESVAVFVAARSISSSAVSVQAVQFTHLIQQI